MKGKSSSSREMKGSIDGGKDFNIVIYVSDDV